MQVYKYQFIEILIENYNNWEVKHILNKNMPEYCLQNQPIDEYQLYLGLLIFVGFFGLVCYCQKSGEQRRRRLNDKNQSVRSKPKIITYNFRDLQKDAQKGKSKSFRFDYQQQDQQNGQESEQSAEELFQNTKNSQMIEQVVQRQLAPIKKYNLNEIVKKFSSIAYNYAKNEHLITQSYRSQAQIIKERELCLAKGQKKPESPAPKKKNESVKAEDDTNKSGIKRTQSHSNLRDIAPKKQKPAPTKPKQPQQPPKIPEKAPQQQNNSAFTAPTVTPSNTINTTLFPQIKPDQKKQGLFQNQPKKQPQDLLNARLPQKPKPQITDEPPKDTKSNKPAQKSTTVNPLNNITKPEQKQALFPSLNNNNNINKEQPNNTILPTNTTNTTTPTTATITTINSSMDYINAIIKYAEGFSAKTQISTNINNLNGARSDPKQLWLFASSYIKTINPTNHDQVVTFSYRIWDAVVNKFMKNTNIKDGFEKIPPKEKNKQVQKNSINTYVLLINIFRVMGFQAVWLGVFGKTLNMLNFLFTRKEPIKDWKKLQLIDMKYIILDGDVSSKYQSRIDFLTYFLLALTTLEPIEAFEEISQKTYETYPFIDQLKRYKHKWSYREFWCLIDVMKKNPLQAYFKIPFWTNALSVIYLQMLKSLKYNQMKQFQILSQWIIKQIKQHTKKFDDSAQTKNLQDQAEDNRAKGYQFDGDEFINGIKTLGRGIDTKQRQMKLAMRKWEDFRDKCSILYYFWRKDTA